MSEAETCFKRRVWFTASKAFEMSIATAPVRVGGFFSSFIFLILKVKHEDNSR
jgi:hypothetical protein